MIETANTIFVKTYGGPSEKGVPPINIEEAMRYAGMGGAKDSEAKKEALKLLNECIEEVKDKLSYRVCYGVFPIKEKEPAFDEFCGCRLTKETQEEALKDAEAAGEAALAKGTKPVKKALDLGFTVTESALLIKHLEKCDRVILFAATVGIQLDRLIAKYGKLSPAKALFFQAIGAERIESLCDTFCEDAEEKALKADRMLMMRYSPGYGDLPLDMQRDIFRVLDCSRKIGLTLNESLLMSPSKSVTAIIGVTKQGVKGINTGYEEDEAVPEKDNNHASCTKGNKCESCGKTDCAFRQVK